jgi:hypothetical protein
LQRGILMMLSSLKLYSESLRSKLGYHQVAYVKRIRKGTSGFFFLRAQANYKKKDALNRELIEVTISSIKVVFSREI